MSRLGFDLILLGDPTSGKDTQAKLLQKKYRLSAVESGRHWRILAKKNNSDGAWLRRTMSLGYPTPVALMKKFLISNLKKVNKNNDMIFVGNPRLKPEAQLLKKLLNKKNRDFFVLYLSIPVSEILKRTYNRPRVKSEDLAVKNRIRYHKEQVSKTVKYFQKMNKLEFINGNKSIKKVNRDIIKALNDYTRSKRD